VFFCTEIAVEKHFDPPKCDFWRGLGGPQKFFYARYRSPYYPALAIFYGPLINYAVIRPLTVSMNTFFSREKC